MIINKYHIYFLVSSKVRKFNVRLNYFLLFVFLTCSVSTFSQEKKVSISLKQSSIQELFTKIESQTDYRFSYRNADIEDKGEMNLNANDKSVAEILNSVLPKKGLQYKLSGKRITITPIKNRASSKSAKITVKGKVSDSNGTPLIGVSISLVNNSSIGTVTDTNGNFSLTNVSSEELIQISYIGFRTQTIQAKEEVNLVLVENTDLLDEVIVVGYAVQKKVNLSGAVATVSTKQLEDRPVLNVGQALQGTVANLNINIGSGQATSSPSFNIRGKESINGGKPLIVIDGIIADNDQLNRMNPTDIASVSILKDAASSAIYGSRAAYGVILVTTKMGTSEKLTINYNNNFSIKTITRMPEIVTDPYDVAVTRNIMGAPWYHLYNEEQLAYAKKVSEDPSISPYFLNPDGKYSYFGQTDWIDEAYKNGGFMTNHTIDISGKTDKLTYYFSGGYNYDDGMIRYGTDKYNRYNLRSKMDFKINDRWNISNNTSFMTSDYNGPTNLSNSYYWEINRISPLEVVRNPDGTWTKSGASVLGLLEDGGRWKKYNTTISTHFNTRYDIFKNVLFAQANFAYTTKKDDENWHYIPVMYYDGPEREPMYKNDISSAQVNNYNSKHLQFDTYLTFNKVFATKHAVTAMVGFNQEEYRSETHKMNRKNLISNSLPSIGLASGDMDISEDISTWSLRSGYGRFNYIFDRKYIFEFNGRYDGTSRFAKDSRFVFNPSASVAWVISEEKFFEPLKNTVDFLKPRFSYGSLGNQDVSNYAYLATMGSGKTGPILNGKQPIYVGAPGLVSGDLTWEKVSTLNIGLDIAMFKNRLSVSADIYERKTKDMLTKGQTLPAVLGTGIPQANAADLKTKGWDLTVNWRDNFHLAGKVFNYSLGFNLADSQAEITRFENPKGLLEDYYEGYKFGETWGLTTLGFFTSQEDIKNHANQTPVTSYPGSRPIEPGDLKFEDRNNDNKIDRGAWTLADHGDYHIIGNTSPRYTYGITASAEWNGIDFSCLFQGVGKKDYFPAGNNTSFWGTYYEPWSNITKGNFVDHWTEENPNGYFPRMKSYLSYVGGADAAIPQTRYKQNASYIRLKNLTMGYTLPKEITRKMSLDRLRIFFSGDNLFVISGLYKYFKVDPELLSGQDYPLQRSFSFGVNVTF